jgi:hypothetical protein
MPVDLMPLGDYDIEMRDSHSVAAVSQRWVVG